MPRACAFRFRIDEHFAGRLPPARERELREHLPSCAACTAHYRRFLLLSSLSPRMQSRKERLRRGTGLSAPQRWRIGYALIPLMAAAAALLLLPRPFPTARFFGRGGHALETKAELHILRVGADGTPHPVNGVIAPDDELGFTYRNPHGKQSLLIFARDEHGHLYWFHPAWTRAADNPRAIPAASGPELHELPEVIRHPFDSTTLHVHAIFTDEPFTVRDIESMAQKQRLDLPGAERVDIELQVRR